MINVIQNIPLSTGTLSLEGIFSTEVLEQINRFRLGELDYLIVRGMPVSSEIPDTPTEIRAPIYPRLEKDILTLVSQNIGSISEKGVEHTIRFDLEGEGTNNETWHSHFQYSSSVFYCVRADANAKTYFLTARDITNSAGDLLSYLTTPYKYLDDAPSFSLIESQKEHYAFSKYIFERSELEKFVKDLDLPDAIKMLKRIIKSVADNNFTQAASYLLQKLENAKDYISYLPGDLIMVHEPRVIRYSPGYKTEIPATHARWLLAVSLEN